MRAEKCKWKYGKQAPVMFMIDDFANKYMTDRLEGDYVGADWGGRCRAPHSLYEFLEQNIFRDFPYLKMTLFLVVGRREAFIAGGKPSVSRRIDENPEFANFLRELSKDERFEVAFHGYTHGKILDKYLTQEWLTFSSLEEACWTIGMCRDIYRQVTGKEFHGGKYCGYEYNDFSDESISSSCFEWWCRHWDGSLFTRRDTGVESLDLEQFGGVVDIPSTVDGALFSLRDIGGIFKYGYKKAVYYKLRYGLTVESILDNLVRNGQVINIQEHSSPMREDGKHQEPNLVDDISNIRYILKYLQKYDLWYATGHEIAEYWKTYQNTTVSLENGQVVVVAEKPEAVGNTLWIALSEPDSGAGRLRLRSKAGEIVEGTRNGDKDLFEIKLKRDRESFLPVRG